MSIVGSPRCGAVCNLSVTGVVEQILKLGEGALLGRMDIRQAYRNIPVAPEDNRLLGMQWEGNIYVDKVLPFGLRSVPIIFSVVADALQWMMLQEGASWVGYYLDDFITMGPASSEECQMNMTIMESTCGKAGIPHQDLKNGWPLLKDHVFRNGTGHSGWSEQMPHDKLQELQELFDAWHSKKTCIKKDLQSIVGLLNHACKAVCSGRSFIRRLIDLTAMQREEDDEVRLNVEAHSDIEWWHQFSQSWNGVSMLTALKKQIPSGLIIADASGNWGCGALSENDWFQVPWDGSLPHYYKRTHPNSNCGDSLGHQIEGVHSPAEVRQHGNG